MRGSERFVAAAVACEAFLFTIPLAGEETLADFRVVATRFADIRRAIRKGIERKFGFGEGSLKSPRNSATMRHLPCSQS